ncbi:hypothetical protein SpCBS45565_g00645 [Spizellomyces sp. 'palustris']|nr:hypothetical protein SpCBS45565_g00645 [Spizellomyces sp. 'palustris']
MGKKNKHKLGQDVTRPLVIEDTGDRQADQYDTSELDIVNSKLEITSLEETLTPATHLVQEYNALLVAPAGKKRPFVRRTRYTFTPRESRGMTKDASNVKGTKSRNIYSYNCLESLYRKDPPVFPTLARGLFVTEVGEDGSGDWKIVIRGYDKFFNVGEVASSSWEALSAHTEGPYEVTLKENGCIIFAAALDDDLVVTSKHALGAGQVRETVSDGSTKPSHSQKGEEWVEKHLKSAGRTRPDFVKFLATHDVTAVFELADDDFEEHILEYPPDRRGLYLHGVNENTPEFRTWESSKLRPIASEFGFKIVDALTMSTLQEVRDFSDSCRATGSYNGRAIEGFVVRCHRKTPPTGMHFFKIKYDEPYLMFREWREVTNRIISGKPMKFNPRFELTRQYVEWVRAKLKSDPILFQDYGKQKGIIRARNIFLRESRLPNIGEHIVAEARRTTEEYARGEATLKTEEEMEAEEARRSSGATLKGRAEESQSAANQSDGRKLGSLFGTGKTLVLPIATIGAGKTFLGRLLTHLFPRIGHIQSDNIVAKKAANVFERAVLDDYERNDVVYADKNNHLLQHRLAITKAFKQRYPGGRIVALDWQIDKFVEEKGIEPVVELAAKRVVERGENHQSLTPKRAADYRKVIRNFTMRRDPVDKTIEADSLIDIVVPLSFIDSPRAHLSKILPVLGLSGPSTAAYTQAYEASLAYQETVCKVVKDSSARRKPLYYGIKLDASFDLAGLLTKLFLKQAPEVRNMWESLVSARRVEAQKLKGWHVTLCMTRRGDPKAAELSKIYAQRIAEYMDAHPSASQASARTGPGIPVRIGFKEVVWDDRVMAIVVDGMPAEVRSCNAIAHATVATASDDVKPVTSNEVLDWAYKSDGSGEGRRIWRLAVEECNDVDGQLCAFYY